MTQKMKTVLGIVLFAVLIGMAVFAYQKLSEQAGQQNEIGLAEGQGEVSDSEESEMQLAPDFAVTDRDGNSVKLSDLLAEGKPIVLNFWASWCPPCKSEMPEFDAVYKDIGDEILFMMVDLTDGQRETVELGTAYVDEQGFSFPVYFDVNQEGAYTYGIRSIPTTLFIDKDGYLIAGAQGAIDEETLRKGIEMAS